MQTFNVTVVREAGSGPLLGSHLEQAQQELQILAEDKRGAYKKSQVLGTLKFTGQIRRTFIDGTEYFDPSR